MNVSSEKLGVSSEKGYIEKFDIAKITETTYFTYGEWIELTEAKELHIIPTALIDENSIYLASFVYAGKVCQAIFYTGYADQTDEMNGLKLTTFTNGTDCIELICMATPSSASKPLALAGLINDKDNIYDCVEGRIIRVLKLQ